MVFLFEFDGPLEVRKGASTRLNLVRYAHHWNNGIAVHPVDEYELSRHIPAHEENGDEVFSE